MGTPLYLLLHFLRETKTALKTNVYLERKKWEEIMKKEKYIYRYVLKYQSAEVIVSFYYFKLHIFVFFFGDDEIFQRLIQNLDN